MSLLILGTDTDAGKTTFASLWLASLPGVCSYWKPVETGASDSKKIHSLLPQTVIHESAMRLRAPVAPSLAARLENQTIPSSFVLAAQAPADSNVLIETFGGPFSPLNEMELQIEFIRHLNCPSILVSSPALGSIGRTLAMLKALKPYGVEPLCVVLIGVRDDFVLEQIRLFGNVHTCHLNPPQSWDREGVQRAALEQAGPLAKLKELIEHPSGSKSPLDRPPWMSAARAADLLKSDLANMWHPYTPLRDADEPLAIIGVHDEFLQLADGRSVIDAISSWWTILHRHRDPYLMAALHEASQSFDHVVFAGATHPPAVRVAELLLQTMPWRGGRVFFSDNGSTAVEVALKMAYQYRRQCGETERTLFVGFENGYHGDTFGAMAVGRDPLFFGAFEPLLFRVERVAVSAERLEQVLENNAGKVAAVIIEPLVQGAGGMRMHSPEELRAIYEVTRRHHVLFIADEVMTGCHRTGTMWAFQAAGIAPDLICAAKTLAGGVLSLAATIASPTIVAAFDSAERERTFFHGHSFTAHPLACAVAAANLQRLICEPPTAPTRMEAFWKENLALLRDHPRIRDIRIRGTIAAVEIDVPGGYLSEVSRGLRAKCLQRGVFLRPLGNVLYALPPFCTSEQSLHQIALAMRQSIQT